MTDHRRAATPSSTASAATSSAGPTPTPPAPTRQRGLNEDVVRDISAQEERAGVDARPAAQGPASCSTASRCRPGAPTSSAIDFDNIKYFVRSTEKQAATWDDLPEDIKNTYDRLGIPEAEKQRLVAGVAAQYESEVVYHKIREDLEEQGVIFLDTDTALQEHPELFKEYFGTVIPVGDNKFAALNTAVWSGGSFIYVPQGRARGDPAAGLLPDQHREHGPVRADADHRRRGRLRALRRGLHRADLLLRLAALRGRRDHREEGRAAAATRPSRTGRTTSTTWSPSAPSAHEGATMEWVDGNIGSKVTMKYPAVYLMGEHAKGEALSVAFAGEGQHQDAGAKMVHAAPHTSSTIISKSIARGGGRTSYRGLVQVQRGRAPLASPRASATRCWSTRSPAPTPTPTSTSARTTCRWATRRPSPRSATTSSST